ncbi:MAG: DNA polymerase I [Candidatus Omnitrophica bacterium CG1_02_40_15]|nr:MAG: DNA polymerase I [Candidatus Omnitrophica bacterium CG1_02_40_15]
MKKEKLFLIDGNSYCYRAFYAIKELSNSKGRPTNAVYGFILMLKKLMEKEKPAYLAVAFDLKGPTFRHKQFEDYKAHRKPMPDDLVSQIGLIKETISGYNIPIFEKQGFEADDILATIAKKISQQGIDVYIVTGDKDMLQIVDKNIKVYSAHKDGLIYDNEMVRERFSGLGPENITDFIALAGDAADNIPGVRGIGEKTAIELIKEFGSMDNIYKNLDKIRSEPRRKMLSEQEDSARISKELAMVDLNVPIEIDIAGMAVKSPDSEKLLVIFKELEFKNFARDITSCDSDVHKEARYKTITSLIDFKNFIRELKGKSEFVLDTETTSEQPMEAKLVGISFCWKEGEAYYVALGSTPNHSLRSGTGHGLKAEGVDLEMAIKELKPILEDEKIKKIGQNIKYDKLVLLNYGIQLKGISYDTMIASYLLNPSRMSHGLDTIAFEYLDHKMTSIDELLGAGKKRVTMDMVDIEKVSMYSCEDSDVTMRLKNIFEKEIFKKELETLFDNIELPLVDVLSDMEKNGIKIDVDFLKEASSEMEIELSGLVKDIYQIAGEEFNINSPKQLSRILFEKLGLPIVKKTKTGASTDVEVLEKLSSLHSLPKELLRYRELSKLKSTYVDALPELINKKTGRLHTSFNQAVTATGRLSSSNPNLQNIPIKTEEGRKIRKAFIGEKGNFIMSADYSQIELRMLAHLSKDPELIAAFEKDRDVHSHTASLIFGVDEKEVTPEMRSNAKTVNFGIIYGISAFGLSKSLGIDPGSAQQFIDSYFERYPAVRVYMEDKIEEARSAGYVTTLFNRRRYIPEIKTGGMRERQQAERIAINTPVQGSAADLIKIAMINIYRVMKKENLKSLMTLQVHDELVFEVPRDELDKMKELVKEEMEGAVKLLVPIKVSVQYGKNWLEMA